MAISCCRYCVAPERHPGCHDHCSKYIAEKAKHDADMAEQYRRRRIEYGIVSQIKSSAHRASMISHKKGL